MKLRIQVRRGLDSLMAQALRPKHRRHVCLMLAPLLRHALHQPPMPCLLLPLAAPFAGPFHLSPHPQHPPEVDGSQARELQRHPQHVVHLPVLTVVVVVGKAHACQPRKAQVAQRCGVAQHLHTDT